MTKYIRQYTETCPICKNEGREPGATSLSLFVCEQHEGEFIASSCAECGAGIFVFRKNDGVRCNACVAKSKKLKRV